MCCDVQSPVAVMAALMASMGKLAQVKTAWNIRNSKPARMSKPHTGCITKASIRW